MHRVNNHRDKSQYIASDYLNILITYLRSLPNCTGHLQTIFAKYDENGRDTLDIDEFELLLSVLIIEACTNSGHRTPHNTELTVSYILNILIQINNAIRHEPSHTNLEFSQHFVTHLLTHLLSLKTKEHKISSALNNVKLKKYKIISPKLSKSESTLPDLTNIATDDTHRFRINRRRTKPSHKKRSQSGSINENDSKDHRNRSKSRTRSRSKSISYHNTEMDNVLLVSSPSYNSLVMTDNILNKYQKHNGHNSNSHKYNHTHKTNTTHTNTSKRILYNNVMPQKHHFSSRLLPIPSAMHKYVSIERISFHGNGSPSDSLSKSKSPKNKHKSKKHSKSKHKKKSKSKLKMKETQRGVQISRRRTESNILSISRESSQETESKSEEKCEINLDLNNDNLMLDLLSEINTLQKEHKQSKLSYTNKIGVLEDQLKSVQSENTVMQQTLRMYEQRIAQMERVIRQPMYGNSNINAYIPHNQNSGFGAFPIPQTQTEFAAIDRDYNEHNDSYRQPLHNVSVLSHTSASSDRSSSPSSSCKRSRSSHHRNRVSVSRDEDAIIVFANDNLNMSNPSSTASTSNKYRALEKQLHLKILREREKELQSSLNAKSRKNASLIRRKKSISKQFEPVQLRDDIQFNDDIFDYQHMQPIHIDPNGISLPLVIDESKTKPSTHTHTHHKTKSTDISALSDILKQSGDNESYSNSEIIIAVNEEDEMDRKEERYDKERLNNHKNNILEALQEAVQKQAQKEREMLQSSISSKKSDSLLESETGSDCFHLFADNEGSDIECNASFEDDYKSRPKYTDFMNVAKIEIPMSEKDLFKKVKPAYKYHLEMIDDDGSITFEVAQRKKRREREKQQQMQQMHSRQPSYRHSNNSSHSQFHKNNRVRNVSAKQHIRMCYFENKPLGFQINESPQCIFVTNVYNDRGTAYGKGIERGWKIIEVNKQNNVKGMMEKLRNNKGPFNITFDMLGTIKNYNKMI